MTYAFIILLVAGIFLYVAFREPSVVDAEPHEDDDMTRFNPARASYDDAYAMAWNAKDDLDD